MNALRRDLAANVAGRAWSMALNLVAVPVYLRYLGAESYGLIGLLLLLENISSLMDAALGLTLNRELARHTAAAELGTAGGVDERRDVLATLQLVHWTFALLAGTLVLLGAPTIAGHWVQARTLDPATVTACLRWMSLSVTASVLFSFYQGGLFGVRRQVAVNALMIVFATLRIGGSLFVITRISPLPQHFFETQGIVMAAQVAASAWLLWSSLPALGRRSRFASRYLRAVWRFAAVVSVNSLLTAAVSQLDKVIFSRVLPLAEFGYYTLAGTAVAVLWSAVMPLAVPFFPRFADLWERKASAEMAELYHRASQLTTLAVSPLAVILCAFANPLLVVWTRNPDTAARAGPILAVLAVGTALNALTIVPANVQNACGWPGLMTTYNMVFALVLFPAIWLAATRYGAVGAAITWAIPNAGYLLVTTPIMHRRLLRGELAAFWQRDVGLPTLAAIAVGIACRAAMPDSLGRSAALGYMAASGLATAGATFLCLGRLRPIVPELWATVTRGSRAALNG